MKTHQMNLKTKLEIVSKPDLDRLHETSLKVLAETGVVFHSEEALEIFKRHGIKNKRENSLFFKKRGGGCD